MCRTQTAGAGACHLNDCGAATLLHVDAQSDRIGHEITISCAANQRPSAVAISPHTQTAWCVNVVFQ
jgi:hypothetical protein